jgi:hypothetical protein
LQSDFLTRANGLNKTSGDALIFVRSLARTLPQNRAELLQVWPGPAAEDVVMKCPTAFRTVLRFELLEDRNAPSDSLQSLLNYLAIPESSARNDLVPPSSLASWLDDAFHPRLTPVSPPEAAAPPTPGGPRASNDVEPQHPRTNLRGALQESSFTSPDGTAPTFVGLFLPDFVRATQTGSGPQPGLPRGPVHSSQSADGAIAKSNEGAPTVSGDGASQGTRTANDGKVESSSTVAPPTGGGAATSLPSGKPSMSGCT